MKKNRYILFLILLIAAFLRFYNLQDLYPFIGDQGWFYLSAKDLLHGQLPLVGITASYTWLHQGAFWTYMLAPVLWIYDYNPVGGAYFSAFIGTITVYVIYAVGKTLFKNESAGLLSALFFAVSPLIIFYTRMPYHTSPIPLVILIFIFTAYKYLGGNKNYLPLSAFLLGVLYNLELATMVFWVFLAIVFIKVKKFDFKLIIVSVIAFLVPMLPIIIYDISEKSGFYQTTAFLRLIKLSIFNGSGFNPSTYLEVIKDLLTFNQYFIFIGNKFIAFSLILISLIFVLWDYLKHKNKKAENGIFILGLWLLLSLAGIIMSKVASEAYLPMFYPGIIILLSYALVRLTEINYNLKLVIYPAIFLISVLNTLVILNTSYLTKGANIVLISERIKIAEKIIELSAGRKYNLISVGAGSEFESNIKNYEYLTWWLGNEPSEDDEKLKFIIEEKNGKTYLSNE